MTAPASIEKRALASWAVCSWPAWSISSGMEKFASSALERRRREKESTSMPISKKRLAELAALPEGAIDTSDIPEADEAFFQAAKLRQPKPLNAVPSVSVTYART